MWIARNVFVVDEEYEIDDLPLTSRLRSLVVRHLVLSLLAQLLRLEGDVFLPVRRKNRHIFEVANTALHLSDERLFQFEVVLLDDVEAVVAAHKEQDKVRDVLEKDGGVEYDSNHRGDGELNGAADASREDDQHRAEGVDAE